MTETYRKLSLNMCTKHNCVSLINLDYDVIVTLVHKQDTGWDCLEIAMIKHTLRLVTEMDMEESESPDE
jgi:hypothetical protein